MNICADPTGSRCAQVRGPAVCRRLSRRRRAMKASNRIRSCGPTAPPPPRCVARMAAVGPFCFRFYPPARPAIVASRPSASSRLFARRDLSFAAACSRSKIGETTRSWRTVPLRPRILQAARSGNWPPDEGRSDVSPSGNGSGFPVGPGLSHGRNAGSAAGHTA